MGTVNDLSREEDKRGAARRSGNSKAPHYIASHRIVVHGCAECRQESTKRDEGRSTRQSSILVAQSTHKISYLLPSSPIFILCPFSIFYIIFFILFSCFGQVDPKAQ